MTAWLRQGVVPALPFEKSLVTNDVDDNIPVRHLPASSHCTEQSIPRNLHGGCHAIQRYRLSSNAWNL